MTKEIENIYQKLRNEIISLQIRPGSKLREVDVSERFHVSRTPIRDVFKQLESDKLLEIFSQSGSYVTKIDLSGMTDVMYIRAMSEYHVYLDIMGKLSKEETSALYGLLDSQRAILAEDGKSGADDKYAQAFFDLDNEFHTKLFEKDGKGGVLVLLNKAFPAFQRYRFLTFLRDEDEINRLFAVHKELLDTLSHDDKAHLLEVVNKHNYSGLNGIDKVQSRHPDYFQW